MDLRSGSARRAVVRSLERWMAKHHGLIDRSTAVRLGATDALLRNAVDSGAFERVHPRVYRAPASPRTPEQVLLAAVLACGEGAVASHCSAAWLWGLLSAPPRVPDVAVPLGRNPRVRGVHVRRSGDLGTAHGNRRGIRVTVPARTILDLSSVAPVPTSQLAIDRAVSLKLVTLPQLTVVLERLAKPGRPGVGTLRRLLDERGVASASRPPTVLESVMARVIRGTGLPPPVPEFPVGGGRYRFDFAWPDILFAVEVDGWDGHVAYNDWLRNIDKRNWADEHGWDVAHFAWEHLERDPADVAAQICRRIAKRTLAFG